MQGEGPSLFGRRSCGGLCSIRSLFVGVLTVAAFVLLIWMYSEQSHAHIYTKLATMSRDHQYDNGNNVQPINVVINMPPENKTSDKEKPISEHSKWNYNWDLKAWKNKEDANGVPIRTILLVRHGKYDLNTGHLTEMGRKQANLTGQRLKELNMGYDRIIHSTMDRAVETAQLIHSHLPHLPISSDDMITEGGPLPPEPTLTYWGLPERSYFVDGPRMEAAFRKYFYRADKTQTRESIDILVGHGNIFRFFSLRALQFPAEAWMRVFFPHASVSLVHINPDGSVTMTKFGDSGHLPPDLVTI